jgi:hypothetical protein
MIDVGFICIVACVAICLVLGLVISLACIEEKEWLFTLIGVVITFVGVNGLITCDNVEYNTTYVPAEPVAHNQTQTVFTTDEGTYLADGLYPDGTYLLTVDGKDVLVVWQAVDGEVG